jgi:soluble lytic murein transglycosylase-like protein
LKHIIVIAWLELCFLGAPRPAQAQIYTHKDANGILVLSNDPRSGVLRTATLAPVSARTATPQVLKTGSSYEPLIWEHSRLQGVRADLVRAVIQVESAFNPRALSPKGAMGLMQLMPSTAAHFGVVNAFNPAENIRAGVGYLKQLLIRYQYNEELALAAYNAGPLAVDRHGSQIPPYKETQDYVQRINTLRGKTAAAPGSKIYKTVEIVDGRPVVHYSNAKPTSNSQEVAR